MASHWSSLHDILGELEKRERDKKGEEEAAAITEEGVASTKRIISRKEKGKVAVLNQREVKREPSSFFSTERRQTKRLFVTLP